MIARFWLHCAGSGRPARCGLACWCQRVRGAAWKTTSREGRDYHSVKLDDSSCPVPTYASPVETEPRRLLAHLVTPHRRVI
ncbi:DUF736 family protein [Mesorhizobium sp. ORM6]